MTDPLANALGVEPNKEIVVKNSAKPAADNQVENDAEYVRTNLYDMIEKGGAALTDLAHIAQESQHPRAYEALALLVKNLGETTDKLMKLHSDKQKLQANTAELNTNAIPITANVVFRGTTADLLRQLTKESAAIVDAEYTEID